MCDPREVPTQRGPDAEGRSRPFAQGLFTPLPNRYDRLAELLSFGQNGRWRREMVDRAIEDSPGSLLDVATGPAGVARQLAKRSGAQIVGIDITAAMLEQAVQSVAADGLTDRISLVRGSGEQLPFPDATFDALTFTYLLRYVPDPGAVLRELARVVRPGRLIGEPRGGSTQGSSCRSAAP